MTKLVFLFLVFSCSTLFAQTQLSGKIINQNKHPINLAEVVLFNKDSVAVKNEFTNEEGVFSLATEKGEYNLKIIQVGKILHTQKIIVSQNLNLGVIQISENPQQLQEVVVSGKKKLIERKVDRLIFNVENSISAIGGDAIDALKVTPGIRVQNDQIAMIGKSGMAVMIDDRLIQLSGDDLINFLKTISSDNIKSIEVITTPPAKYDAEGNSGIVNIKLKKAKRDSWSAAIRSRSTQATYFSQSTGANYTYQKNKTSLLADLSYFDRKNIYQNRIEYIYPTEFWKNLIDINNKLKGFATKFNVEYEMSSKTRIGLQYNGSHSSGTSKEIDKSSIYNLNLSNLNKQFLSNGNTDSDDYNHSVNFNLTQKIDTMGKRFAIDIDYFVNKKDKKNPFYTSNYNYQNPQQNDYFTSNNSLQKIQNFSSRIDFEMPNKWADINFGGKLSFTVNNSNLNGRYYEIISQNNQLYLFQNNIFNYEENNQALYFSLDKKCSKKWTAKAGLRIESTQTKGYTSMLDKENKTNYIKLFPTVYLSYQANENQNFSLNFSRRIERPAYYELDPARWYTGLNSYVIGNPFMQPSFNYNFEFSHTYKGLLVSTLSYSKIENGFGQLTTFDISNDKQVIVRENYYNGGYLNLQENATLNINKNWSMIVSASTYYSETNTFYETLAPKYSGWGADFNTTQSFILNNPKTLLAEINFTYGFPSIFGETLTLSGYSIDTGLKYTMLNNQITTSLNVYNIFKTDIVRNRGNYQNIAQSYNQYYDTQRIRLSISYVFGNKALKVEEREGSNTEEKGRTGS